MKSLKPLNRDMTCHSYDKKVRLLFLLSKRSFLFLKKWSKAQSSVGVKFIAWKPNSVFPVSLWRDLLFCYFRLIKCFTPILVTSCVADEPIDLVNLLEKKKDEQY